MLLSLNWLSDHVDLTGTTPEQLAELLTMRTALIEGFVDQAAALQGVVVGRVLTCVGHPDADRLSVCTVDHGTNEPAEVVCGAPNVASGQAIVYAPVGMQLPNGLKLKQAKIRGVLSDGMICAEDEIGLGTEHDGTIVLDDGLTPGTPIGDVSGFCDVIFEIDLASFNAVESWFDITLNSIVVGGYDLSSVIFPIAHSQLETEYFSVSLFGCSTCTGSLSALVSEILNGSVSVDVQLTDTGLLDGGVGDGMFALSVMKLVIIVPEPSTGMLLGLGLLGLAANTRRGAARKQ